MKTDRLQALLKWPGGKSRMVQKLLREFPKHESYVEPFAGGAALFFAKPLVPGDNVIGDFDNWVTNFYRDVRNGKLNQCRGGIVKSRDLFERSKKNKSACYKVANTSLSFHGGRSTYVGEGKTAKGGTVMLRNKLMKAPEYQKKLRKSWVLNRSFEKTMRKFDTKDTLHFLDPPWPMEYSDKFYKGGKKAALKVNQATKKYAGTAFDPFHVAKVSKSMKGHVIVIINDAKIVRRAFCSDPAFKCKRVMVPTNFGHGMEGRPNLIIHKRARKH
jgi:DNA adenine methylase